MAFSWGTYQSSRPERVHYPVICGGGNRRQGHGLGGSSASDMQWVVQDFKRLKSGPKTGLEGG